MSNAKAEITKLIEDYFAAQSEFDGESILKFWHPEGMMYLVGNQGEFRVVTIEEQARHMKEAKERVPDLTVEFMIDEIEQIVEHDNLIASVRARYRMVFTDGYGKHRCFYNLANIDGKWGIVNAVDRGLQVMPEA